MVLLFETKAGWNQHGGPELFTFDNHEPKGGCVLLNDGTVKFIRTEEELQKLRWKWQNSQICHLDWSRRRNGEIYSEQIPRLRPAGCARNDSGVKRRIAKDPGIGLYFCSNGRTLFTGQMFRLRCAPLNMKNGGKICVNPVNLCLKIFWVRLSKAKPRRALCDKKTHIWLENSSFFWYNTDWTKDGSQRVAEISKSENKINKIRVNLH